MNDNDIKNILKELYAVDPELKPREKEIIAILHTLAIKPRASYDATFSAELRSRLLAELSNSSQTSAPYYAFFGRNMRYSIVSLLALALIGTAAIFAATRPTTNNGGNQVALNASNVAITHVGSNAFGALDTLSATATTQTDQNAQQKTAAGGTSASAPAPATANSLAAPMNAARSALVPVRTIYTGGTTYDYIGDPFSQNKTQLDVLKKISAPFNADQAATALMRAGFGQIDLSTFSNLAITNATLSQNESFGYQISLDFANGTISINENYNEWPQETLAPLTSSNIPSNDAVISIANQFLKDHNISTSNYGAPHVTGNNGLIAVPASAGSAVGSDAASASLRLPIPWYSDTETVLYPLTINGLNVYDTGGNITGLSVDVNVRYHRVANVYGLNSQNYQASAYDAITSTNTILSMAENSNGSIYPPAYPAIYNGATSGGSGGSSGSAIGIPFTGTTLHLNSPTMAYVQAYQYGNNGSNTEFLVPAFVFPVTGSGSYANQNIVVPLIQEFAQKNPPIKVMPYGTNSSGATPPPTPVQSPAIQ